MTMRATVLSVTQYDFTDDNNKNIKGAKVNVISEDEAPYGGSGHAIATYPMPVEQYHRFQELPGIYDLKMSTKVTKKGVVLKVEEASLVLPLELTVEALMKAKPGTTVAQATGQSAATSVGR